MSEPPSQVPKPADGKGLAEGATTEGLPVAPSLGFEIGEMRIPRQLSLIDRRAMMIVALALVLGVASGFLAEGLRRLIMLFTNISFFGRVSTSELMPAVSVYYQRSLGWAGMWVIVVPVVGGIIVGFMARFGSRGIRGHGIPEAMEQVLTNESRIPPKITWLKPLSAAIAIGTGGPFGAEGPIIATGGAMGSVIGQVLATTSDERKTLLAAGAAAGMAATFGSPVSAVLLAVELLLFEFRPRSLIPTALAAAAATGVHIAINGAHPIFAMSAIGVPSAWALATYIIVGGIVGMIATFVTRGAYYVEDLFGKLPVHWMWWPAIGGLAVGLIGVAMPLTLGVGYPNIVAILGGGEKPAGVEFTVAFVGLLVVAKFLSWAIALGSGTSGGTLAPLFTMGGGAGLLLGALANWLFPSAGIDMHVAALVGMAAMFAGAARAMLASVVFAFETTLQPMSLLPLLGGCAMSYLVSCLLMRNTIMTEKIVRRGVRVPAEYQSDFLDQVFVRDAASKNVVALPANQQLAEVRAWLFSEVPTARHQGFPVVDAVGHLVGMITRRDIDRPGQDSDAPLKTLITRPPVVVYDDCTLREAADHMVRHDVGRLPVISRNTPGKLVGMITRSDLLRAHRRRLSESYDRRPPTVTVPFLHHARTP